MSELKLETPQDYFELYKNMGCIPYMMKYFHQYDDIGIGPMCRALHMSKAYAISQGTGIGKDKMWCKDHKVSHSDLIIDANVQEMLSRCPVKGNIHEHPRYYNEVFGGSLVTYNDIESLTRAVTNARTIYFLQFLWKDEVLNYKNPSFRRGFAELPRTEKRKYITAFIPLLEIDAANIDKEDASKGRYNILDKNVFEDFITVDGYIKDRFKKFYGGGEDGYFHKAFSGNGLYYIGYPNIIKSEDELVRTFRHWVYVFCKGIIDYLTDAKLQYIHIDAPFPQWNSYYKIPFTLHKKYNRIAIPLSPNNVIELEYIQKYSNPRNITPEISEKLWKEGGYK